MNLPRQRLLLLGLLLAFFLMVSGWLVWQAYRTSQDTFLSGVPPQDIRDVIIPKEIDVSQLRPPALRPTDPVRFGGATSVASVIEFGDYECPACKEAMPAINRVVASYGGKVRFVWRDFPIYTVHPRALDAAVFARCAGAQGKYWVAHDALLLSETSDESALGSIAQRLSLDVVALDACRRSPEIRDAITREVDVARGDGLMNAPTIFVGTKAYVGPMTEEDLRNAIDLFLKS